MKSITRFGVLVLSTLSSLAIADEGAIRGSTEKCILQKVCSIDSRLQLQCDNAISFGCSDINTSTGYVITQPGVYCLREDCVFTPGATAIRAVVGTTAITINASNVTLNLNGKTLSQANKSVLGVNGIVVNPGLDNVKIINGTIRDFSNNGIQAGALASEAVPTPSILINFYIKNVNTFNNGVQSVAKANTVGGGGIVVYNSRDVIVKNVNANENVLSGMFGVNITDFTVEDSHFDNNTWGIYSDVFAGATQPWTSGLILISDSGASNGTLFSGSAVIKNSTFDYNSSVGQAAALAFIANGPFSPLTGVAVDSCTANNTSVVLSDPTIATALGSVVCIGIILNGVVGSASVNNCQISETSLTVDAPLAPTGFSSVQGIRAQFAGNAFGTLGGIRITNCIVSGQKLNNNTHAQHSFANQGITGFEVFGELYIAKCQIFANSSSTSAPIGAPTLVITEGVDLSAVADCLVEDCFAGQMSQVGQPQGAGISPYVAGFKVSFNPTFLTPQSPTIFRRCVATSNQDTGTAGGNAFGFTTRDANLSNEHLGVNYIFDSCIAENNTVANGSPGIGVGFDILNCQNAKVLNCKAEGNNIGILVSDLAPNASSNNIVAGNIILANTLFGIQDTGALSNTNAYYQNQAKNNGATPAVPQPNDTNFNGGILNTIGTPIRTWLLPNPPSVNNNNGIHAESLDNISINL